LSGGSGFTQKNTRLIKRYRNPATEFNLTQPDSFTGYLSKDDAEYKLAVFGFLKGDRILELTFPTDPRPKTVQIASAKVIDETSFCGSTNIVVSVEHQRGKYDHTILLDNKLKFVDGYPTRLTLGVYWSINCTGINHVEYTVGYKYAPDTWFVVARASSELEWITRSQSVLRSYYAKYLYTVPLDVITSPIQLAVIMLFSR